MSYSGHLWAIGFNDMGRAAQVCDEITRLGRKNHDFGALDVAVAVRCFDGSFSLNGEAFSVEARTHGSTVAHLLAGMALGAPPLCGAAVGALLGNIGALAIAVGISDEFVREVAVLIKPGTSVLFVLDEVGNMDSVLHSKRGLGGTVLKTNVDLERAKLIQSTLAAYADADQASRR